MDKSQNKKLRLSVFLHSGSYDRVHSAFSLASVALAMGGEVEMFVMYGALYRLLKNAAEEVSGCGEEEVGKALEKSLRTGAIRTVPEMISMCKKMGGLRIWACSGSMALLGISRNELIDEVDGSAGLAGFVEKLRRATALIYI